MTSVFETCMEQIFGLLIENCWEGAAVVICDTIGAFWEPFVKQCVSVIAGGK